MKALPIALIGALNNLPIPLTAPLAVPLMNPQIGLAIAPIPETILGNKSTARVVTFLISVPAACVIEPSALPKPLPNSPITPPIAFIDCLANSPIVLTISGIILKAVLTKSTESNTNFLPNPNTSFTPVLIPDTIPVNIALTPETTFFILSFTKLTILFGNSIKFFILFFILAKKSATNPNFSCIHLNGFDIAVNNLSFQVFNL